MERRRVRSAPNLCKAPPTGRRLQARARYALPLWHLTLRLLLMKSVVVFIALILLATGTIPAQPPPQRNPNVSNKALITKSTPGINTETFKNKGVSAATATLHKLADEYYAWRNEN